MTLYDAELINAVILDTVDGRKFLIGDITGDSKGRFKDGEIIRTTTVQSVEGDIYRTKNTTYKVTLTPLSKSQSL